MKHLEFYIYNNNKVITKSEVYEHIQTQNPGLLLPMFLADELLANFGYQEVIVKEIDLFMLDTNSLPYCSYGYGEAYQEGGQWYIEAIQYIDKNKINAAWLNIREERNKILSETDWITSSDIALDIKFKYTVYRQLLRDVLNIVDYPHQVVMPTPPDLDVTTFTPDTLSLKDVETIRQYKNTSREWLLFLEEWKNIKFTTNRVYVSNLMRLYAGISLNEII